MPARASTAVHPPLRDRRRPHHHRRLRVSGRRSVAARGPHRRSAARASSTRRRPSWRSIVPSRTCERGRAAGARRRRRRTMRRRRCDIAAPFATGLHQVDNPVFDRDGNLVCDLQRHARPAGAGLDLPRAAQRHARAVLLRHRQPDVDGDRSGRPALRLEPLRRHGLPRARRRRRRRRSPPISASPAASRSRPTARCSSAIAPGRSSSVDRDGRATTFATLPAERRGVPPRVRRRTACSTSPRRRCRPTTRSTGSRRTATVTSRYDAVRPAAGARVRSRTARCSSSRRWPAPAACIACRRSATPELVLAGPGLVGVAFDARRAASSSLERHRVSAARRSLTPHLARRTSHLRVQSASMSQLFQRKPIAALVEDTRRRAEPEAVARRRRSDHAGDRRGDRRRHLRRDRHRRGRADRAERRGDPRTARGRRWCSRSCCSAAPARWRASATRSSRR